MYDGGGGGERRNLFSPSPQPFFCFRSNFRAITRLETLATQAKLLHFKSPYTVSILSLFFEVSVVNQKYSRLSLNGHLYKTDTSLNGHLELVPAFLYSLYLTLYKTDISLRRTLTAGPKGVPLRGS